MKRILGFLMVMFVVSISTFAVSASFPNNSDVGVRLKQIQYDDQTKTTTYAVQMKLPANSGGVTAFQTTLSFNNNAINIAKDDGSSIAQIPSDSALVTTELSGGKSVSDVVEVALMDNENLPYQVMDASLINEGNAGTVAMKVSLLSFSDPATTQNVNTWQNVFYLHFSVKDGYSESTPPIWFTTLNEATTYVKDKLYLSSVDWLTFLDTLNFDTNNVNQYGHLSVSNTADRSNMTATINAGYIGVNTKILGDVNGNREITAIDAAMVIKYVVNLDSGIEQSYIDAADVNKNSLVSAVDALMILKHVAGHIDIEEIL